MGIVIQMLALKSHTLAFASSYIPLILKWHLACHITSHLLSWALGGGATNSPHHVLYTGVLYSC